MELDIWKLQSSVVMATAEVKRAMALVQDQPTLAIVALEAVMVSLEDISKPINQAVQAANDDFDDWGHLDQA